MKLIKCNYRTSKLQKNKSMKTAHFTHMKHMLYIILLCSSGAYAQGLLLSMCRGPYGVLRKESREGAIWGIEKESRSAMCKASALPVHSLLPHMYIEVDIKCLKL